MHIVTSSQAQTHGTPTVTVYEYDMPDADLGGAVADITGRYPATGFVLNREVKQLVYVLQGAGEILTPQGNTPLLPGDMLLLAPQEAFAWNGQMKLFLANAPKFTPQQYKEIA